MAASDNGSAPAVLPGADDHAKLGYLCSLTYKQQAVWFLNAFWSKHSGEAEKFWAYVEKASSIDMDKKELGSGLDELNAHRLLEIFDETLTVREMRTQLRKVGAIGEKERPKLVPLAHLLLARYKVDWHRLVNASQGDNAEELAQAQKKLDEAKAAVEKSQAAEAAAKKALAELTKAAQELKAQEDAYFGAIADAEKRSETGGVVSRNRAKAELAQLKAEDPLPLRRAKITNAAALKKSERANRAAEEALVAAQAAFAEAEKFLEEVKMRGGSGEGSVWWMERELHEQRKYLPSSRGGIAK